MPNPTRIPSNAGRVSSRERRRLRRLLAIALRAGRRFDHLDPSDPTTINSRGAAVAQAVTKAQRLAP